MAQYTLQFVIHQNNDKHYHDYSFLHFIVENFRGYAWVAADYVDCNSIILKAKATAKA